MKYYLLGWNSSSNKYWLEKIKNQLCLQWNEVNIHEFSHRKYDGELNFDKEYNKLLEFFRLNEDYILFSKSVWTLLASKLLYSCVYTKPKWLIMIWTAYFWAESKSYPLKDWIKSIDIPTLVIHKEYDPAISFSDLENLFEWNPNIELIKIPGKDHSYENIDLLLDHIFEWQKRLILS